MKKITILTTIILTLIMTSCNDDDSQNETNKIEVKFIEQICCGNLMTLNNVLVNSSNEGYKDSLLAPINFNKFAVFPSVQIGDIVTIEYELAENYIECEIMCNRHNGIPIKLITVEN
jgi:hypothetical protein